MRDFLNFVSMRENWNISRELVKNDKNRSEKFIEGKVEINRIMEAQKSVFFFLGF